MSSLTGRQIEKAIYSHADDATRKAFHGVHSMDQLPFAVPHYPFFMIVNTHPHNLPGEHWIAVFIDQYRRGEVFDSLALPIPKPLAQWLNQFTRSQERNSLAYQHPLSYSCGAFAIYFVFHRLHSKVTFSSSLYDNDKKVVSFYDSLQ